MARDILLNIVTDGYEDASQQLDQLQSIADETESSFNDMTVAEAEASKESAKLGKESANLGKVVGDLSSSVLGSNKAIGNQVKAFNEAREKAFEYAKSLFSTNTAMKSGSGASKAFSVALRVLSKAFLAIPIFAVIAAFTSLIAFFSRSQKGADFLEKTLAQLGAIFDVIIERVVSFGEGLFNVLSGNLGGLTQMKESFNGIGQEIQRDIELAGRLARVFQRIRDRNLELSIEFAKQRSEVERLKKVSDDTTLSIDERLEAAQRAAQIEKKLLSEQIALKAQEISAEQKRQRIAGNPDLFENKQKLADLEIQFFELSQQSLTLQTELQNKENALAKEREANLQKEFDAQKNILEIKEIEAITLLDLQLDANKKRVEASQDTEDAIVKQAEETAKQVTDIEENSTDLVAEQYEIRKQRAIVAFSAIGNAINIIGQIQEARFARELENAKGNEKLQEEIRRKQARAEKSRSIFDSIINTAVGVTKALGSALPPFNFILAGIVAAQGAVQTGLIASQPITFQRGGLLVGASHDQGGIPIRIKRTGGIIEAEGNEAIINAKSIRSRDRLTVSGTPRQIASAINSYKGYGRSFQFGGIPSASSVSIARAQSESRNANSRLFKNIRDLKVVNVATETGDMINKVSNIEAEAST